MTMSDEVGRLSEVFANKTAVEVMVAKPGSRPQFSRWSAKCSSQSGMGEKERRARVRSDRNSQSLRKNHDMRKTKACGNRRHSPSI
jgi:hypothetical protein